MPITMFFVVLAAILIATLLGLFLATVLPKQHVNPSSKEIIRAFMDVNALLAAVVLGLLVFAAKTAFDTKDMEWKHSAANIILLDRLLAQFGPETDKARKLLRATVAAKLAQIGHSQASSPDLVVSLGGVQHEIGNLSPVTDSQQWLKRKALDVSSTIAQARWFLLDEVDSTMPLPFLAVMVFWLALIFFSYGLFTPTNFTVLAVVFLCAISLAATVFLIMEMDQSMDGLITISTAPLREAMFELGHNSDL